VEPAATGPQWAQKLADKTDALRASSEASWSRLGPESNLPESVKKLVSEDALRTSIPDGPETFREIEASIAQIGQYKAAVRSRSSTPRGGPLPLYISREDPRHPANLSAAEFEADLERNIRILLNEAVEAQVTVVLGVYSDALLADGKVLDQIRTDLIRIFARRADGLMESVANQDAELWDKRIGPRGVDAQGRPTASSRNAYQSLEEHFGRLLKSREWCAGVARFCASLLRTTELVDELHHLAKYMTSYFEMHEMQAHRPVTPVSAGRARPSPAAPPFAALSGRSS
jgi:hypothetical protein